MEDILEDKMNFEVSNLILIVFIRFLVKCFVLLMFFGLLLDNNRCNGCCVFVIMCKKIGSCIILYKVYF